MLVAIAISAVAAAGLNMPTNAQQQDQQDKQKQEKQQKKQPPAKRQQRAQQQPAKQEQQKQVGQQQQRAQQQQQQRAQQQQQTQRAQQQQTQQRAQQQRTTPDAARVGLEQRNQRLSRQRQDQLIQQQRQRATQYDQRLNQQQRLATQRSQQLQQQKRLAQYRYQEQYLERLRQQQIALRNAANYDYYSDPYFSTAPSYRYRRGSRYYQTNQYGADLLRQALNYGYEQGLRAGQADREDGWRPDYQNSYAYQDANYGYGGYYIDQTEYNYYFREGFRRGYDDGYYGRYRYGSNSNGKLVILATVLSQILNFQSLY